MNETLFDFLKAFAVGLIISVPVMALLVSPVKSTAIFGLSGSDYYYESASLAYNTNYIDDVSLTQAPLEELGLDGCGCPSCCGPAE